MKVNILTASGSMLDLLVAWAKLGHQQRIYEKSTGHLSPWSDSDILQWAVSVKPSENVMEDPVNNAIMHEVRHSKRDYHIQISGGLPGVDTIIDMYKDGSVLERYVGVTYTEAWLRCYVFMRIGEATVELPEYFAGRIPT